MAYNPLAPLTPRQQRAEALALLRAALLPERQGVKRARLAAQRKTAEESARAEGLARALAQMQQGIGGQTLAGYQGAAQTQGALAKGFSETIRTGAEADAKAAMETLARLGAPTAQQQQVASVGKGAGDVTYFQGGYNPATAWAKEGAALAAAQNQLPATTLGRGQQQVGQLARMLAEREKELDERLADLEAKAPGTLAQILQGIRSNEQAKVATDVQKKYLELSGAKFDLETRATGADITGIDPATGLPTLDAISAAGTAAGKRGKDRQAAVKAREKAFTDARGSIFNEAQRLAKGEKVPDPATNGFTDKVVKPSYKQARQALFNEFGPPLLRYASAPGKAALKRRIWKMIDTALKQYGLGPKPKVPLSKTRPG